MTKTEAVKVLSAKGYKAVMENEIPTVYFPKNSNFAGDIRGVADALRDIFMGVGYNQSFSVKVGNMVHDEVVSDDTDI